MHPNHIGMVGHVVHAVARATAAISLLLLHFRHHGAGVAGLNIQQEASYTQDRQPLASIFFKQLMHSIKDSDPARILSVKYGNLEN
ncbi:MAG: hypothetical protein JKY29_00195 [Gammaproteobacteria bacterium]|nr:hypothetical protein [Gammaproteobacteria bacterium]